LIIVADTGSGIAQPEKIFDPFYSTKEVGSDEGMGLGCQFLMVFCKALVAKFLAGTVRIVALSL